MVGLPLLMASVAIADGAASRPSAGAAASVTSAGDQFGNMSLDQLINQDIQNPGSLIATETRIQPVDVFMLDATDIEQSGARDLNHLLEDYVPNVQVLDHHTPGDDLGIRGVISDREDKYLYQVNGVTLNNRMLYGANIERDIPLLGDMDTVNVVTGPASATYGSGALAGVIDVGTYNGLSFQGADLRVRQGIVDQYESAEMRFGRQLTATSGLFIYYGIASVQGADAPYYIGTNQPAKNGLPANNAGQPYDGPKANLGAAAFDEPWQKAYVSYLDGPWEFWTRFVQEGTDTQPRRDVYTKTIPAGLSLDEWTDGRSIFNQQSTTAAHFRKDLSDQWSLEFLQSFDVWAARDQREGVNASLPVRSSDENQLFTRLLATWKPIDAETLAFGTEYSHIWYHDPPQSDALDRAPVVPVRDWQTDTNSFLAENQYRIGEKWTTFLSIRADKNTYQDWLLSPRGTLVYEPNKKDTIKLMAGQAVRRQDDEDIWGQWFRTRTYADPEKLLTCEWSYDHKFTDELTVGLDSFYEDYHATGWNPSAQSASDLGHFQIAGGDITATYRSDHTRVTLSEGVSTLIYGSVPPGAPAAGQVISSAPYGFGNELADWSPSITKLAITHDINSRWSCSTSVVYYGGFPGAHDYAKYSASLASPPSGVPLSSPGNTLPYGPNVFWNLGLEFRPSEHWTLRVDGYDLAALFDPTISKRNYILRESEFSVQPAAVALSVKYSF
jgi:hypothetical protein